ncbi:F-box protein At5g07610-like [Lolium rigidum]|uniref:F-box protein At5g07610-like n=1 Tax=Lolium rigidum TaxID=89674 RepID=UPI001F5CC5B6|nr:F-box protein At5g07610-like [Lolium rigidum]
MKKKRQNETTQDQEPHPVGSLPTDVLFGILSRVPYKSLCRFKCVSKPWQALCSEPDIRKRCKRSSQTLSGFFFYKDDRGDFNFRNLSGRGPPLVDPSLPFLRGSYDRFEVEHCCGGLLLCKCWASRHEEDKYDYVVCNPMTWKWTVLPPLMVQHEEDGDLVRFEPVNIFLGFEAARPSRFTVFAPLTRYELEFSEIAIYSSKTRRWIAAESDPTTLAANSECVFLNGNMHLPTDCASVLTIDTKGEEWGDIKMPDHMPFSGSNKVSIGQSQGLLHAWQIYKDEEFDDDSHLYVWVLEDYDSGKWRELGEGITVSELFRREPGEDDFSYTGLAIHPDSNCIFLTDEEEMTLSYDMESKKVNVISSCQGFQNALPYKPCFAKWKWTPDGR